MTLPSPVIASAFLSTNFHIPYIFHNFSTKTNIAFILASYPLGLFLGSSVFGFLSDFLNRKYLLTCGLLLAGIMQLLSGKFIEDRVFVYLLISRIFSGLFEGSIVIARTVLTTSYKTEDKKIKQVSNSNAALTLGWIIGPLLGGIFSNPKIFYFFNASTPFYLGGCLSLCTVIIIFFYLNGSHMIVLNKSIELSQSTHSRTLFNNKNILKLLICTLLITLGVDFFYQNMPVFLVSEYNYSPFIVGSTLSLLAVTNITANILINPMLGKHLSSLKILIIAQLLFSSMVLLLGLNQYYLLTLIIVPIIGFLIGTIMTNLTLFLSTNTSWAAQGRLMGWISSQRTLGTTFAAISLAPLLSLNNHAPFILSSLLIIFGTYFLYKITKKTIHGE